MRQIFKILAWTLSGLFALIGLLGLGVYVIVTSDCSYSERDARRRLTTVAEQWRELFEHVR